VTGPRDDDSLVLRVGGHLRAPRAAGVAGLAFAVLYTAALVLFRTSPFIGTDPQAIAAMQPGADDGMFIASFYLFPFAGVAFLWFVAVVRDQVDDRRDRFFATVLAGSGELFVGLLFIAGAVASAITLGMRYLGDGAPTADQVGLMRSMTYALLFVFGSRAAGIFLISFSTVAHRTRAVPTWLALPGFVIGLTLMFVVTVWEWVVLVLPAWVAIVSVGILVLQRRARMTAPAAPMDATAT